MQDALEKARRVFAIETAELEAVAARLDDQFTKAIGILESTVNQRGKIIIAGVGKSGHIGDKIAATLSSTGSPAIVLNSLNALHGDLGIVCDGDAVIALSSSGETDELIAILRALARFDVRIIGITGVRDSTLGKAADAVLDVAVGREACPMNLAPTSSTTAMLVLGDALAMVLLEARGFRKEDFAKFHPGGILGRSLLLRVRDIMRPAESLALVRPETPVTETILAMTRSRSGAAIVTDPTSQKLAGIFTHGDLARHFPNCPEIGSRPVAEFMTHDPVSIGAEHLAAEVLHILQSHRIDDIVVVDAENHPVGLVDSQDLSRLKVL
jgi:arabinose-5-phosphate isomerase